MMSWLINFSLAGFFGSLSLFCVAGATVNLLDLLVSSAVSDFETLHRSVLSVKRPSMIAVFCCNVSFFTFLGEGCPSYLAERNSNSAT